MPVAIPECTNFIDCNGDLLTPVVAVDLTSYDKFAGKGNNPSLGPSISGSVISYDFSSWTNWPEAWSWDCGVWIAGGNDVFIGQGAQGSCANVWASLNDVLATMNALDPNGLSWSISGTTISATALSIPATGITYQVATCADIPVLVDCNGDPLTPAGSTSIYSVLSKHSPAAYAGFGAPWDVATYVADITAGPHGGWFMYEWCFAPGAAPANDPNGHTIYNTPYTSNPDLVAGDVITPTGNASPTCASGTGPVYGVATCDDIVDLQTQIDALAASEKYVVSGVIQNPNTATATLVLTLNDASTISIDVSSLEDAFTAAQILALFPNGANVQVTTAGTSVRFLGQDGQWHTLTIPATTNALTSSVNTMTSTVDGVVASAPIVNSNTLAINGTGQIVSTVNGVVASLTYLSTVAPPADGVGDTRAGAAGTQLQAARRDHVHPIEFIQAPPAFGDLLLTGQLSSAGAIAMAATYTTEETITYCGQKPVTANTGTWSIATPPALAGYILTSFEGSPYSPAGMDSAAAGPAGGGSRDFNWMYTTYYDNVRRNALAHNLSFKAEYRLN